MHSVDSSDPSTSFEWLARDVEVQPEKLDITAEVIRAEGKISKPISLELTSLEKEVGFGSYNLFEAKIKNNGN